MKKTTQIVINPASDKKYAHIKLGAENQKKHNDLAALLDRMKERQTAL